MSLSEQFYSAFIKNNRWQLYLQGLGKTIEVTFFAAMLGLVLGTVACLLNMQRSRNGKRTVLSGIAYVYIDVIRGTPTMIQLLIMWNVIMAASKNKILVASLAQMEAGRSLGLTRIMTMKSIILPQAFKNCFPSLLNEFITLLKETSIAGAVGLAELTHASDQISSATFSYLMPLLGAALMYFAVVKFLSLVFGKVEKKLRESDNR